MNTKEQKGEEHKEKMNEVIHIKERQITCVCGVAMKTLLELAFEITKMKHMNEYI